MALLQVTGLWEKVSKQGTKYFSGDIDKKVFVYIYENQNRKTAGSPSHTLYFATDRSTDSKDKDPDVQANEHSELLKTTVQQLEVLIKRKIEKIKGGENDWFYRQAD
jgi:predicted NAD/FAD-dependent oxidoreductase